MCVSGYECRPVCVELVCKDLRNNNIINIVSAVGISMDRVFTHVHCAQPSARLRNLTYINVHVHVDLHCMCVYTGIEPRAGVYSHSPW